MGVHLPEETKPLAAAVDRTLRACYALCPGRALSTRTGFRSHRKTEPPFATALYSMSDREAVASD